MADEKDGDLSTFLREINRRIIPRWRESEVAATTGELEPYKVPQSQEDSSGELALLVEKWREYHSLPFASDLVSAGLVLGIEDDPDVIDAANYVLSESSGVPAPARGVASRVLGGHDAKGTDENTLEREAFVELTRQRIHTLRRGLRADPRNGLLWVDIARNYVTLGADEKARKAMKMALLLAEGNRFVLRSAARLYVHLDEAEQAYDMLRRSPETPRDPWLRAAEIAVASILDKTPQGVKRTRNTLHTTSLPPKHISELACAIATLELGSGSEKSARKLFRLALRDPTENSVAQANWATGHMSGIPLMERHFVLPRGFEARSFDFFRTKQWVQCMEACNQWFRDEPFSSRPVTLGTFTAIVAVEDYGAAIRLARQGLMSDPRDFLMRNNLVVGLAESGNISEALIEYDEIPPADPSDWQYPCWLATKGLLEFRLQRYESGRDLYCRATKTAQDQGNERAEAMVLIHWAREELISGQMQEANEAAGRAKDVAVGESEIAVNMAFDRYESLRDTMR